MTSDVHRDPETTVVFFSLEGCVNVFEGKDMYGLLEQFPFAQPAVGMWEGELELSFFCLQTDFDEHIRDHELFEGQEAVLELHFPDATAAEYFCVQREREQSQHRKMFDALPRRATITYSNGKQIHGRWTAKEKTKEAMQAYPAWTVIPCVDALFLFEAQEA